MVFSFLRGGDRTRYKIEESWSSLESPLPRCNAHVDGLRSYLLPPQIPLVISLCEEVALAIRYTEGIRVASFGKNTLRLQPPLKSVSGESKWMD